jgi:GalNAc-alpha-(1->4)-GalNAc-alpha-(1->3)-diNAcBac-PP-undecaprenol alpha-1,4-N-acetyl-D-galactosaminyltransferase
MKIVFLCSSLGAGGAERVASILCNAWSEKGYSVTLIPTYSGGGQPFYPLHKDVHLRYLADEVARKKISYGYLTRIFLLRKIILSVNPDVVISFLPNVNLAAIFVTSFTGIPCVIGERSDPLEQPIGKLWTTACRLFYRFADVVTVQTSSVAARIGLVYPKLRRVIVIPNPLPPEIEQSSIGYNRPLEDKGRRILLSVGRLSSEKRPENIIEAFLKIAELHPDWDLHFVGDGPLLTKMQHQIKASSRQRRRIVLHGRSDAPWDYMRKADIFVLASAYEGFPNALLEAVALGLPSISTDCNSGPRDISEDGQVVMLVPLHDDLALAESLSRLMADKELRNRLRRQGAESVRARYKLQSVLDSWNTVFTEIRRTQTVDE